MRLSHRQRNITALIAGAILGGGLFFLYMLRAHTYLTDDPSACVNCHIMSPYYATWMHSSHSRNATCNDCHVPHENFVKKWTFKGMDGVKHVAAFLTNSEPQVIQAHPESSQVIMNNCIRCHQQLNTELVKPCHRARDQRYIQRHSRGWSLRDIPGMDELCSTN